MLEFELILTMKFQVRANTPTNFAVIKFETK